ncbi:MAG TPA: hypothetical protein PLT51_00845 [Candidatus Dojkabacteria bacterium]|jgi:hypothetical protein|nr:hypothetical protein [Candidatus Dojkabacteria bacterium]
MATTTPSAQVAQIKHNDVNYIVAATKYHTFPVKQVKKIEPVKLRTKFKLSKDYSVITMEELIEQGE